MHSGVKVGVQNRKLAQVPQGNGMTYKGGPVVLGTPNVYLLYVGYAQSDCDVAWTFHLTHGLRFSNRWLRTATQYNTTTYGAPTGTYNFAAAAFLSVGGQGGNGFASVDLSSDAAISGFIRFAQDGKLIPTDPNGIYIIIPNKASNIQLSADFCSNNGWCSTHGTIASTSSTTTTASVKWAIIPSQYQCGYCNDIGGLSYSVPSGPSGDSTVDSLVGALATSLLSVFTNPSPLANPAYINSQTRGDVAAGKGICAGQFSMTYSPNLLVFSWPGAPAGVPPRTSYYNQIVLGIPYLLPLVYNPAIITNNGNFQLNDGTWQVGCVYGVTADGSSIIYINFY